MMKYIKLFALLLLFILQSCKKEDEIISYPIVYSNFPTTDNSIKVFTRNGEITDSVLINYFNRKYGFLLTGMNNYNSEGNVLITYLSPEKVELRKSDSDNLDTLSVFKGSDLIYFEEKDTISSPIGLMSDVYYFNKIFKYKPLYYEEFKIPVSSGYSRAAKYKHSYFVKAVDEDLILPMIDFIYKLPEFYFCALEVNNEFCRDSISNLGENDTIIVNIYSLKFKKNQ